MTQQHEFAAEPTGEPTGPPGPPKQAGTVVTVDQLLGVLTAVLVAFGSFGAWVDAGLLTVSGIKGDGAITLIAAVVALIPIVLRRWPGATLGCALVVLGVAIYDIARISSVDGNEMVSISIGWGLVAVVIGGIGLSAWALVVLARADDKRPAVAAGTISAAVVAVLLALAFVGAFGDQTEPAADRAVVPNTGAPSPPSSAPSGTTPASGTLLRIREQARLAGSGGTELMVTLERVVDSLQGGEFDEPSAGMRFVGVFVRLTNTGDVTYDDAPGNGAVLTYGDDRQARSSIVSGGPCSGGFSSSVKISPGRKRQGCIVFEVPRANTIKMFQLTLDSGFADQSGEWNIRPANRTARSSSRGTASAASSAPATPWAGGGASHACDQNISAGAGTTCEFANDVFRVYAADVQSGSAASHTVSVYSSAVGHSISMDCAYDGSTVRCTGGANAFVTFPKWAADVY